ncbi:TonB-dependent receptor [Alteromonas mediterranea]|uniref:TonB-dependent receptor n=1 Tax=Alteromonas mediterranea TaxID=314275 RepID=A0AAC9F6Y1_9ALTE|nr:TonB-dependent receptor plug domain-containing protein [Alteromonas mediterranea]AFV85128.1 TonB-dependent receptor [Alteromonas mediterranea DE1]AGP97139.1 TonB-dependent receptor [Alteromonas mediterranea UM7]AGQ01483.1 TonB-dependent receptor [Alteromonas mediterranea UM4b]AMJ78235.1 TonB-dependent receptor [Alteromonas mediterranea]AMJ82384.1 TonB-dependent receptor [Alteromonas mediterranea]|tara:strand:+ start:16653 stop:19082 length:2430 start_codon:yes stop_codon:yes gene_type:complete
MKNTTFKLSPLAKAFAMTTAVALSSQAFAQEETEVKEKDVEKIQVTGSLGSLPGQDVESVFGFGKSILETPRSASTISQEQMERFNVSDIDELVAFAPGTFTQSFFGVAGSLDVRGTPGETYFRGVKRLDNPGNYPTPIGASSRIDIVRGPASPIYGPSKIGGYLNFNPKSARASGGQYLDAPTGALSYTTGSWDKSILTAEVGGPASVAGKEMGYYIYGELENSDSYYDNTQTDQTVLQASFNVDITDNLRFEFGGMYHDYDGNQVAGWNRLTQELVDDGTYITGTAQPLDTDGDGQISHEEYGAVNIAGESFFYVPASSFTDDEATALMQLENVGTTTLSGNQVLVAPDDQLGNEAITLYFDTIYYTDNWEIRNQLFYDAYDNINENAYGFSQFHDSWVVEDKLIFATEYENDGLLAQFQFSPSVRYTDFEHGDDFTYEYFNRRDLTMPSSALDRRLLSTRSGKNYDNYDVGNYLDLGVAAMTDLTWDWGLNLVLGVRYDTIDIESTSRQDLILPSARIEGNEGTPVSAEETVDGWSWNASISYEFEFGLIPYITAAEQATLVAGQGAEIGVGQLGDGSAFDTSELIEFGVKGSLLDDTLYFALSSFEQERTDFNAQNTVTNNTTNNKGTEFELRWVVNDNLVVSAGYTNIKVINLTALENGNQFGFLGAEDLVNLEDPSLIFGGNVIGLNLIGEGFNNTDGRKAGIPENIYTLTATYDFQNGYAANVSVVDVEEVASGFSAAVTLPAYTLVNAGLSYQAEDWAFNLTVKNLTDERYFRSNFPDLFGSQIVLPELPRHFNAKFTYTF